MRKVFSWGLLALASAVPARADDVTEEAFLAALDQDHAAVRALGADLARAEAARRRVGALANPRIEVWREQPDENPTLTNWTIAWTPPLDGRLGLGKSAADAGVAAARAELALDRAGLRREVRRVFADWSIGYERCALLADRLERIGRLAEQERQRARLGTESGLAARRLTLAEAMARAALREAEAERGRAEAGARGWEPGLHAEAVPVVPELPAPPETLEAEASPRVRAEEHRLEQAQLEARLAGRFWGFPTLQAGVQRLEQGGLVESGPIVAASWSIPLFDRSQGERAEARARARIAASSLEQVRALTRAEMQGGLDAYRSLFAAAREAREAAAESDRVIVAATAAYRAGESSLTDLLDSLSAAFEIRLRELEVRERALAAHRDLEATAGRPLSEGGTR
jgi:outer membrane protein TolC